MYNKFLIIILSLSLLAEDEKSKSAVIIEESQVRSQSTSNSEQKRPILYLMHYPKDMSGTDDITGYQLHNDFKLVNSDGKERSSQDLKASLSSQNLTLAQLQDLTIAQMFDKAKLEKFGEFQKLTIKPDFTKALSIIKKLKEKQIAQEAQSQTSSDVNLSVDAVDELNKEFEPNITRHKIVLDLDIPEQEDFYHELIYLISLGLNLEKKQEKVSMFSSKIEDKKLFTLIFVDQLTEDKFKNELKYFRKIAKIRASHPDAILPKKYLDVAQELEGEELQKALNNYYREYESQVKSVLADAVAEAKKLPYHDFSVAIQAAINKSKEILGDYLQIANELIEEPDYKPTSEITEKVIEIKNLLQFENSVIKTNLSNLKDYLEKNNFNGELIEVVRKLFTDINNFRKILLTKSRLEPLSQETDFSAAYENIKKFFDAKAVKFYDQKYQ